MTRDLLVWSAETSPRATAVNSARNHGGQAIFMAEARVERRLAAILAADVVGYSEADVRRSRDRPLDVADSYGRFVFRFKFAASPTSALAGFCLPLVKTKRY